MTDVCIRRKDVWTLWEDLTRAGGKGSVFTDSRVVWPGIVLCGFLLLMKVFGLGSWSSNVSGNIAAEPISLKASLTCFLAF